MDSAFAPDGGNLSYIESLYQSFLDDPDSVPEEWKMIFRTESSKQLNQATLRQHQGAKERASIKAKLQTSENESNEQIEQMRSKMLNNVQILQKGAKKLELYDPKNIKYLNFYSAYHGRNEKKINCYNALYKFYIFFISNQLRPFYKCY